MNPRQRLASLTHELAHLRHGDDGIALLAELWRALAWFFLPVHLTMRFLHREREYRCDDLAALALETPEDYALWLLDLAPVCVESSPPLLAASLLGRTSLAGRIRSDRSRRTALGAAARASALGDPDLHGDPHARHGRLGAAGRFRGPRAGRRAGGRPSSRDHAQGTRRQDPRGDEAL